MATSQVRVDTWDACVDFPIFDAKSRSLKKAMMSTAGGKIGTLEAIYVDTVTDEPAFATVTVGIVGRRRLAFVPLAGATVAPDHLRVTVAKDLAKQAPSIDTDGELTVEQEPDVFAHYSLPYTGGVRRLARR